MATFEESARQANRLLFEKFGAEHVSHTMNFADTASAQSFLLSLSMISGSSFSNMACPDHAHVIPILHDGGVFLILAGRFALHENREIRSKAAAAAGFVRSVCPAGSGSLQDDLAQVLREEGQPVGGP